MQEDVEKENTLDKNSLADLPIADEQDDSTKAGKSSNGNLQINQFYYGATQPDVSR